MLARWSRFLGLAGLAFNMAYGAAVQASSDDSIFEDTFDEAVNIFEEAVVKVVRSSLDGFEGVVAQVTMDHKTTPPISSRLKTSGLESEITIGLYCDDCDTVQPAAFDFASNNYSGWNSSWLGFALDSFDAFFELEIDLSAEADGNLTLSLHKETYQDFGVVVDVEFQLYLAAHAQAEMSFLAGLNLSLTNPAAIMMPVFDPIVSLDQSQAIGFDTSNFNLTPIFNASTPQVEFDIQLSLRTVFSVTVEEIQVGSLFLDLPAFDLNVTTLSNALSTCEDAPPGTPSDQIYADLIHMQGGLVAELSYELLGGKESGVIDTWPMYEVLDKCFAFFPGLGFIGDVPSSPKAAVLTAPPPTICTTGSGPSTTSTAAVTIGEALRQLSPGQKAGGIIGTVAGVSVLAILAFFAGRRTRRHVMKEPERTASTSQVSRFASLRQRQNFAPVASGEQMMQTSAYAPTTEFGGDYFPHLGPNARQHSEWQTFANEPFRDLGQHNSWTPTAVSSTGFGDYDVGVPLSTARAFDSPGQYQRDGLRQEWQHGEEMRLLHSPERPGTTPRGISRKPVPGQRQ